MIKAVIFDLDGTLLDTRKDLADSINLMLKDLNKEELPQEEIIKNVGNGIVNLVERCVHPKNLVEKEKAVVLFKKHYENNFDKETKPYPQICEVVDELIERNVLVGVNSNKDDIYTKKLIEKHFKNININYVLGYIEGNDKKPSPQGVNEILKKMNISKDDALYIGDSKVDIATACNASIYNISCSWGYCEKAELEKEANYIIEKPQEILKYIEEKKNA